MQIIADFFKNKIGWILVRLNAALLLFGIVLRGGFYREFHLFYEPFPIWIFVFANFPAILLTDWPIQTLAPVQRPSPSMISITNREFLVMLCCSLIQWLLIGVLLTKAKTVLPSTKVKEKE